LTSDSPTEVEALVLLCDAAQAMAGKLYVLGGGWSQVSKTGFPGGFVMALAIRVAVPWDRANEQIPISIRLLTDQGAAVTDPADNPVEAATELEVGRPPGLKRGTPLDACLAINFNGLPLDEGSYAWILEADGSVKGRAPFRVLP
jgi:hypothetical protein